MVGFEWQAVLNINKVFILPNNRRYDLQSVSVRDTGNDFCVQLKDDKPVILVKKFVDPDKDREEEKPLFQGATLFGAVEYPLTREKAPASSC